jgi:hypothetical protein
MCGQPEPLFPSAPEKAPLKFGENAKVRLARAGFEDIVYNEAIVGEEAINVATRVFAPGTAPAVALG